MTLRPYIILALIAFLIVASWLLTRPDILMAGEGLMLLLLYAVPTVLIGVLVRLLWRIGSKR